MERAKEFFGAAMAQAAELGDRVLNSLLTNRRWQAATVAVVGLATATVVLGLIPAAPSQ